MLVRTGENSYLSNEGNWLLSASLFMLDHPRKAEDLKIARIPCGSNGEMRHGLLREDNTEVSLLDLWKEVGGPSERDDWWEENKTT